ncbi:unnamed protein product [Phyllotreta striolata]|uniref:Ubiquitin-like domain-containing protein n=1 Tax=Phyllotreta striolata TaxID=444603 RepID=A0A9N9THK1_PHYSR|nr:unnamed protein product [Phyllotreta striolata]
MSYRKENSETVVVKSTDFLDNKETLSESPSKMQIFVKIPIRRKTLRQEIDPTDTIEIIKSNVEKLEGIPLDNQRVVYDGVNLQNEKSLLFYNITDKSTLYLLLG